MISNVVKSLLIAVLMFVTAEGCDKYDVPAGSAGGDSAGNNQPAACQVGEVQMNPISYVAPEVYNYAIFVDIEDADCGGLEFKDKISIDRVGAYGNPQKFMVFDDGKSGIVTATSPYRTGGVIEKSIPHNIWVEASVAVTASMVKAGAAWLTCRIERNAQLVTGLGQVGLARVAITGTGIHTVNCRVLT